MSRSSYTRFFRPLPFSIWGPLSLLNISRPLSPASAADKDPQQGTQQHDSRSDPSHDKEGRPLVCLDTDLVAILIDGINDFDNQHSRNSRSNSQSQESQLQIPAVSPSHPPRTTTRERLTKSSTKFKPAPSIPSAKKNPTTAPTIANPANPTPTQ